MNFPEGMILKYHAAMAIFQGVVHLQGNTKRAFEYHLFVSKQVSK